MSIVYIRLRRCCRLPSGFNTDPIQSLSLQFILFIFSVTRPQKATENMGDQRCGPQVNHRSLPAPLENKTPHNDVNNNRYVEAPTPRTTESPKPATIKSEREMNHKSREGD